MVQWSSSHVDSGMCVLLVLAVLLPGEVNPRSALLPRCPGPNIAYHQRIGHTNELEPNSKTRCWMASRSHQVNVKLVSERLLIVSVSFLRVHLNKLSVFFLVKSREGNLCSNCRMIGADLTWIKNVTFVSVKTHQQTKLLWFLSSPPLQYNGDWRQ